MRYSLLLLFSSLSHLQGFSQTFQTSGTWGTGSNWSTGSMPSGATIDVTVSANPTVNSSAIIGAITDGNNITYAITGSGSLTVGASGTSKNMTFNNSGTINISSGGQLEIWGDLVVANNLTLNVVGSLIVHGNVTMGDGGSITVEGTGTALVHGNLTGQQNTHITTALGGTLQVNGALSLGSGSSSVSNVLGSIKAGSCSCSGCAPLVGCTGNVVLPVLLLFFKASPDVDKVDLQWATASEINFDYFVLEKSMDGVRFLDFAHVRGLGTSTVRSDYSFEDRQPFADLSYYRLTAIDFDGSKEKLDASVVAVQMNVQKRFEVFPNPVSDGKLTAKVNFDSSPESAIFIYNELGVLMAKSDMPSPQTSIAIPMLNDGLYVARFSSNHFSQVVRFVVSKN